MKILLKNATLLPECGFGSKSVNVLVEEGKIAEITEKLPLDAVDSTVDCGGNLLIPGFYNAHCFADTERIFRFSVGLRSASFLRRIV